MDAKARTRLLAAALLLRLQHPSRRLGRAHLLRFGAGAAAGRGVRRNRAKPPRRGPAADEALIKAYPNFRLAHLVKGDLLLARGRPISTLGNAANAPQDKARRPARGGHRPPQGLPRQAALPITCRATCCRCTPSRSSPWWWTPRSRASISTERQRPPRFVADYYISHGKAGTDKLREGDKKTPIGVYHVTASLPRQKLTDFYGSGAFPINYPNEWDKRQGRNGHGIWLHGTPSDTFSRPPKASDGCVVLANRDLDALAKNLQIGLTPVIISNSIEWLSLDDWQAERRALLDSIEAWRSDWESLDTGKYPAHYSHPLQVRAEPECEQWSNRSARSMPASNGSRSAADNISMFRNPARRKSWWSSPSTRTIAAATSATP
jgi:hypothetical protein